MKFLNAQQLAFILDIKKEDARAMMCVAWASANNETNKAERNHKGKIDDPYPIAMPIDMLSRELNLPILQRSVDDIVSSYLVRPATRKWILCDLPEKIIKKAEDDCIDDNPRPRFQIPPALRSMLPIESQRIIFQEWEKRFPKYFKKEVAA